jgi:hypothetical protein
MLNEAENRIFLVIALVAIAMIAFAVAGALEEEKQWQQFAADHDCVKVEQIKGEPPPQSYFDLKRKIGNIVSQTGSVWGNKGKKDGDYFVNIAKIKGDVKFRNRVGIKMNVNMISDNFYVMVNKDTEVSKNSKQQPFAFATELEANNFLNYIKTDFARFCLSILKNNGNLRNGELALIPWLDFAQEWSDEKLYKQFGLTQVEINFIEKIIPKYYGNEKIG